MQEWNAAQSLKLRPTALEQRSRNIRKACEHPHVGTRLGVILAPGALRSMGYRKTDNHYFRFSLYPSPTGAAACSLRLAACNIFVVTWVAYTVTPAKRGSWTG